jgi:hypothetical protein
MWLYEGTEFTNPESYYGFIYLITNNLTGRKYIGRKYFTKAKTRQVKGKKKRSRVDSEWVSYWGSCQPLLDDILTHGQENFTRTILRLCKTRGETNYWEAKLQFQYEVLEGESDWYNANIMMKFTRRNIGNIKLEAQCVDQAART